MEIRQLRYFICVAETKSFSEASRMCNLSQSAISQQIKLLETELNTLLFMRTTHVVTLTESGEQFIPLAREALKSFENCREHMNGIRGIISGKLNIGLSAAMEPYVRHAIIQLMKRYPNLHVNIYLKPTHELHKMLISHELDIAFSINTAYDGESIESVPINTDRVCAVMSKTHPLAKRDTLSIKDLIGQNLILLERNQGTMRTLKPYIEQEDMDRLNIRGYIDNTSAILNILQETNMISLLSPSSAASRSQLVAKNIKEFPHTMQNYAHTMKDVSHKQSCKVFMDILINESIPYYHSLEEASR